MAVDIGAVKMASADANAQAASLEYDGRTDLAVVTYETLFRTLRTMGTNGGSDTFGWLRVVLMLTDLSQRLALDTLASARLDQLHIRAITVLDLPDITELSTLREIQGALRAAIAVGAPRYNSGDVRGCCSIYWATGHTLLAARPTRGFPGCARAMGLLRQVFESPPATPVLDENGVDAYAWALRHAFDAVLNVKG